MANENEIAALRQHAEDRIKLHGTNAMLKVRATLCRDIASGLVTAQTQVAAAERPLDPEEASKVSAMREERDAATSAQAGAENELILLRAVAEAGETGKKHNVMAALESYRAEYPSEAGNTAERAPVPEPDDEDEDDAAGGAESVDDVNIPAGGDAGAEGGGE